MPGFYDSRDPILGLQLALKEAKLPFRDLEDLHGRHFRAVFQIESDDDDRPMDLHVICGSLVGFHLNQGLGALTFTVSNREFDASKRIQSLRFDLERKKWYVDTWDAEYSATGQHECAITFW